MTGSLFTYSMYSEDYIAENANNYQITSFVWNFM